MKKKDLQSLRAKEKPEIKKLIEEKVAELTHLTSEISLGRHKNVRAGKNLRREIAQLKTILREKEFVEETK